MGIKPLGAGGSLWGSPWDTQEEGGDGTASLRWFVNIPARALGPSVSLSLRTWLFQGASSEGALGSENVWSPDCEPLISMGKFLRYSYWFLKNKLLCFNFSFQCSSISVCWGWLPILHFFPDIRGRRNPNVMTKQGPEEGKPWMGEAVSSCLAAFSCSSFLLFLLLFSQDSVLSISTHHFLCHGAKS